jgi:hypothetical protein
MHNVLFRTVLAHRLHSKLIMTKCLNFMASSSIHQPMTVSMTPLMLENDYDWCHVPLKLRTQLIGWVGKKNASCLGNGNNGNNNTGTGKQEITVDAAPLPSLSLLSSSPSVSCSSRKRLVPSPPLVSSDAEMTWADSSDAKRQRRTIVGNHSSPHSTLEQSASQPMRLESKHPLLSSFPPMASPMYHHQQQSPLMMDHSDEGVGITSPQSPQMSILNSLPAAAS